jgi:acetoin utilization protein AcuB
MRRVLPWEAARSGLILDTEGTPSRKKSAEVLMLVRDRMTPNPITITSEMPVSDALELMREKKVRRLPVLNKAGGLIGIVSEKDILYASPSPVTSLSVWELRTLMHMLTVKKVMTQKLVTIAGDAP